jgi:NAD(P)-dependent dehydrogenase (short-subunit alcohol dehydrogenase family)
MVLHHGRAGTSCYRYRSKGFGQLISKTLTQRGFIVFATMRELWDRNANAAAELREFGRKSSQTLHVLEMDVNSDWSVENCIGEALRQAGRIDVLVNNAGFGYGGLMETFTTTQTQRPVLERLRNPGRNKIPA